MKRKLLLGLALLCVALGGCATRLGDTATSCLLVEFALPSFALVSEYGVTLTTEDNNPLRTE